MCTLQMSRRTPTYDWLIDSVFMLIPAQAFVDQFLMTFKDYPTAAEGSQRQHGWANGPADSGYCREGQRERVLRACARLNASRAASCSRSLGAQTFLRAIEMPVRVFFMLPSG